MSAALPSVTSSPAKRKPYPAYKGSGVEWLGALPAHWETRRIKDGYDARLGKMLQNEPSSTVDTLEPYLRSANVTWEGIDISDIKEMWFSGYDRSLYQLEPGDLVVCEGGDVGRSALWRGELAKCYIQNAVHRVRARAGFTTEFLYYWLYAVKNAGYIDLLCNRATIAHLTAEKLRETPVFHPPIREQRAIASFLDRETAKIDALVAKKERLIELLQEKRTALINQAVTKGLDPTVPLKDSGVEWLGEIPAHWQVTCLKFLAQVRTGIAKGRTPPATAAIELPYLRVANVQSGYLDLDDVSTMSVCVDEVPSYALKAADVLMNEGGDYDKLGRGTVWDGQIDPCLHQNHVFAVRPNGHVESQWLATITLTSYAKHFFIINSKQSTNLASISSTNLAELPVVVPPAIERSAVLQHIHLETVKLDALIAKVREHIEKLREYRTGLISAAVTGKIDVREEMA